MKCRAGAGRYHILADGLAHAAPPAGSPSARRDPSPSGGGPAAPRRATPVRATGPPDPPYRRKPRRRPPMIDAGVMVSSAEADQLRQQLLQAQKLSSVGALASSVAHEFNNILTTIINYARMALRNSSDEATRTQALEKILKGSQRAATIINSMLGFA